MNIDEIKIHPCSPAQRVERLIACIEKVKYLHQNKFKRRMTHTPCFRKQCNSNFAGIACLVAYGDTWRCSHCFKAGKTEDLLVELEVLKHRWMKEDEDAKQRILLQSEVAGAGIEPHSPKASSDTHLITPHQVDSPK